MTCAANEATIHSSQQSLLSFERRFSFKCQANKRRICVAASTVRALDGESLTGLAFARRSSEVFRDDVSARAPKCARAPYAKATASQGDAREPTRSVAAALWAACARRIATRLQHHLNLDRKQMIDHVSAAIRIAMHRLGSSERIGSASDQRLFPWLRRCLPVELPQSPGIGFRFTK